MVRSLTLPTNSSRRDVPVATPNSNTTPVTASGVPSASAAGQLFAAPDVSFPVLIHPGGERAVDCEAFAVDPGFQDLGVVNILGCCRRDIRIEHDEVCW